MCGSYFGDFTFIEVESAEISGALWLNACEVAWISAVSDTS